MDLATNQSTAIPTGDKLSVLLQRLDYHVREIQICEEKETRLFEWSSALLLAALAAVVALSDSWKSLSSPIFIQTVASVFVFLPTMMFCVRILGERKTMARHSVIIEKIESALRLFDDGVYAPDTSLYPEEWRGPLAPKMVKRKAPKAYAFILAFMAICVVATLWFAS